MSAKCGTGRVPHTFFLPSNLLPFLRSRLEGASFFARRQLEGAENFNLNQLTLLYVPSPLCEL